MIAVKLGIVLLLAGIAFQDYTRREVYAFVFPLLALLMGYVHYTDVSMLNFLTAVGINIIMVLTILLVLWSYAYFRIKKPFFREVLGLGDVFYFLCLAVGFPTVSFTILFVFSILFTALAWLILKPKAIQPTVPLAGGMALFTGIFLLGAWSTNTLNLYLI